MALVRTRRKYVHVGSFPPIQGSNGPAHRHRPPSRPASLRQRRVGGSKSKSKKQRRMTGIARHPPFSFSYAADGHRKPSGRRVGGAAWDRREAGAERELTGTYLQRVPRSPTHPSPTPQASGNTISREGARPVRPSPNPHRPPGRHRRVSGGRAAAKAKAGGGHRPSPAFYYSYAADGHRKPSGRRVGGAAWDRREAGAERELTGTYLQRVPRSRTHPAPTPQASGNTISREGAQPVRPDPETLSARPTAATRTAATHRGGSTPLPSASTTSPKPRS